MLCGEIGLSIKQFDALTWRQLDNIVNGYYNKQERAAREAWEQTRLIMFASLAPHQKEGKKLKLNEVLSFSWEKIKPKIVKKISFDEAANFIKNNQV